jgi:hypothetical protein
MWAGKCSTRAAASLVVALILVWARPASGQADRIDLPSSYFPGYQRAIKGEDFTYHSPLPYAGQSLLVRSLNRDYSIAWETSAVPDDFAGDTAVFALMAAIDVNDVPRHFDLFVNGRMLLEFDNPTTADLGTVRRRDGVPLPQRPQGALGDQPLAASRGERPERRRADLVHPLQGEPDAARRL